MSEDTRSPGQRRYESAAAWSCPQDMRLPGLFEPQTEKVPWGKLSTKTQLEWAQAALPTNGCIFVILDQWYEDREAPFRLLMERNLREIRDGDAWAVLDKEEAMRKMFAVAKSLAAGEAETR